MGRIAIVSASLGAGHDGAAQEIGRRLADAGYEVDRYDFLEMLSFGIGRRAKATYRRQLDVVPQTWEWLLNVLQRHPSLAAVLVWMATVACRNLGKAVFGSDAVVSTYPLASQVLDQLRRRGMYDAPLITYLTDPSVHPLWITEGTDLYLAAHPGIADQVRMQGGRCVAVVAPAVRPEFHPLRDEEEKAKARALFDLPEDATLALIASGSWAVGEIERSAREVAAAGSVTPVVVCGDNETLRERLADLDGGIVLGWVDDMPSLLRACDVAVLNSGGLTFFEARASGLPVFTYRALAGHGRTNARLLASAGLAPWLHNTDELDAALAKVTPRHPPVNGLQSYHPEEGAVGTACPTVPIAGLIRQWTESPHPAHRSHKVARRLAVWSTALLSLLWMCTFGTSMAVANGFRAVNPTAAQVHSVFFVVDLPTDQTVTRQNIDALRQLHAALAVSVNAAVANQDAVRRASDAGLLLVNSAGGQPYETGIFTGRGTIGAGARLITQLTSHRPNLMLSNGDVDAIDVGMAAFYHERIVVPKHVLTCGLPLKLPATGGVVLVHSGTSANCALSSVLHQLATEASAEHLHPTALEELRT
ncbi:MAG TPA: glycosyltransferase [Pseudonocardiaceae bacterium]|nr:glycosyltransferase [Pseudonocardiaceae bacterium]